MADNDFVRRSMQIVGRGFVQSTTNYFDNAISFVNDTKEIIDMGVDTAKNAFTKYNDMRNTGVGKKFRDWFYNEGGMFGDFDFGGDDDFDAGFDIDSADDNVKESAQPLTSDQLESVSKKQTGAIYKALGKNADLHMANTAEIVSAINGRSAELTASVNNLNNTLVQIGKRLDLIVEYTAGRMKKPGYESSTEKSIFDYNGQISVSSLKDVIKEAMEDSLTGSLLSTASNLKEFITPESISQMVFSGLFEKITFRSGPLKGKSVNDVGEFINESIGQAITDGFTKLLTSKNELLSTLFSDIISDRSSVNFQKYATNQYNDKPAVFDGMTRKSIITVIPGYLNEILKAVNNGKGMSVDNKGNLSDKEVNYFVKNVSENMFGSISINRDVRESTYQFTKQAFGKNISRELMIKVYEAIQASWLFWMYSTGTKILEIGQVTDLSRESTLEVIGNAVEVLSIDPEVKVSPAELTSIVRYVLTTMDEKQFRNTLNARYKSFKNGMIESTQNSVHGYQAGKITKDVWLKGAQMYNDKYKDTPSVQSNVSNQIGGSSVSTTLSTNDYLHGIYSILNRGVNVYVTGSSSKGRKSAYKKFDIRPGIGHTSTIISPMAETNVDTSSAPSQTMPQLPSNIAGDSFEAIDAQRYATLIANEGDLSPQDQKELARLKKEIPNNKRAAIAKWLKDHRTLKGSTIGINPLVDVIQDNAPGLSAAFKNSKIGAFSGRVFNAGKNVYNRAKQAIFGQETVDANGEVVYEGGAVNAVSNAATNAAGRAADYGANLMPTSMLQRRADNLFNSVASRNVAEMTHDQIEDQQLMQLIQQEMPLVMSNGAVDEEELNALMTNVRSIKDPELKRQINRTLIPLLRRNKVKVGDVNAKGEGGGAKTTLGKVLSMGLGVLGMIFKPVLTYIKYVGGALLLSFKKISGKILKVATWGFKTGAQQIYYGTKSMAKGAVSMIKLGMKAIKPKIDKIYEGFRGVKKWFGEIKTKLSNWLQDSAKKLGNFGKSLGSFFGFGDGASSGDSANKENFFTNIMKKFRNTEFGKGFMYAHDERKKIKANDLLSSAPETKTDAELGRANTTLSSILSVVQAIGEKNGLKFGNKNADGTPNPTGQLANDAVNAVAGGTNQPQMDDIKAPQTSGNAQMDDVSTVQNTSSDLGGQSTTNPSAGANAAQQGASAANKLGSTVGSAAGLISGGAMAVISGILKFVMSIVVTLKGFKAVFNLYKKLFQSAFKPLNSFFNYILKEFKPVLKAVRNALKSVMTIVTTLLKGVLEILQPLYEDVIQPLYEALTPALDSIVGILEPIFALLGSLMKVVMIPMLAALKFTIIPIINIIADVLSYIAGAIMVTVGTVESILGGIFQGIGTLISLVGKFTGGSIKEYGTKMIDDGKELSDSGNKYIAEGIKLAADSTKKLIADTISFATLGIVEPDLGQNDAEAKTGKTIESAPTDQVANTYANGDVSNTWIYNNGSSDIYNTYGGEYQRGMGGYLNMNQRGCGPIALADMYNRRGGHMSARDLASSMYGAGAYDPTRGTSIGSYLSAGRALGMGLHAGTVTQDSLKLASPSNPITVIGSGSDYGTRNGNNHYMNVIGADRHGGAYVSNPLTGRVERKPASTIAGSSVVGIYGSGDYDDDEGYTFPEAIKEAFSELKSQAAKILGLFTMDDEDDFETQLSEEKNSAAEEQAKKALGDKYDAFAAAAEELGREKYRELYPQRDGQSDDDYEAAFQKWYKSHSSEYLAKAKVDDMTAGETAKEIYNNLDKANSDLQEELEKFIASTYSNMSGINNSIASSGGGRGYFTSDEGVPLWTGAYEDNIQITDTDITKNSYNSPLFEFFAKTMGYNLGEVVGSSWFTKRNNPDREGVGQSGGSHSGIDFTAGGITGKPLYATTGGKVVQNSFEPGGGGNMLIWQDSAGKYHWYMHMNERSLLNVGDTIEGGDLIGYAGNTGESTGEHLHYTINNSLLSSGTDAVNPLMYFRNYNPLGGALEGDSDEEKIYAYMVSHGFLPHAAAGAMGCFQVESANNPNTLEGYYAFDDGTRTNSVVKEAMRNYDTMDDYVLNKLFPMLERSGVALNKAGYRGSDGHYYPGIGLAQWTGNRTRAMSEYTVAKGLPWSDLAGQLDYLRYELDNNSTYSNALTRMNNSNDVDQATEIWLASFEGVPGNKLSARQKYARDFYERFRNWTPDSKKTFSPTGQGSMSTGYGVANSAADGLMASNYNKIGTTSGKNTGVVITENSGLNLRSEPSINSDVLLEIPKGTELELEVTSTGAWFKTSYGGKTGYVSSQYIMLNDNDANHFDYGSGTTKTNNSKNITVNSPSDAIIANGGSLNSINYTEGGRPKQYNEIDNDMWVASNWLNPYSTAKERGTWYKQLAKIHNNATSNSQLAYTQRYKDAFTYTKDGTKVYPGNADYWQALMMQMNANRHYAPVNSGQMNVDLTWNGTKDEAYWSGSSLLKNWGKKGKNVKANSSNSVYSDAMAQRLNEQLGEMKGLRSDWSTWTMGSGDMSESDFWNDYLGWNGKTSSSTYTPIPDSTFASDLVEDATGNRSYNVYNITRGDGYVEKEAFLKTLFAHTFDVRSDSMEALLQEILVEVKRRNKGRGTSGNTNGSTKLFDEQIPSQVARLSIG